MTLEKQLALLIDKFTPRIRTAFLASIKDVTSRAILKDMVKAIEIGDVEGAFRAVGMSPAALRPISLMIEQAFETGGILVGNSFPDRLYTPAGRTIFRFDIRDSRAEAWLRNESSQLVTKINEDTRAVIRNTLTEGLFAGRNPRNVALDIVGRMNRSTGRREGGVVGLTENFERAVSRMRKELVELDGSYFQRERRDKRFDSIVAKAIKDKTPLSPETINQLSGRYSDRLLQLRGENIGRSEAIAALNRSEWEAVKQAVDMGAVNEEATVRVWDSSGDNRTRRTHRLMEGQTVGIDEPFVSPSGDKMMHPGDRSLGASGAETVACRCRVKLRIDFLSDLD